MSREHPPLSASNAFECLRSATPAPRSPRESVHRQRRHCRGDSHDNALRRHHRRVRHVPRRVHRPQGDPQPRATPSICLRYAFDPRPLPLGALAPRTATTVDYGRRTRVSCPPSPRERSAAPPATPSPLCTVPSPPGCSAPSPTATPSWAGGSRGERRWPTATRARCSPEGPLPSPRRGAARPKKAPRWLGWRHTTPPAPVDPPAQPLVRRHLLLPRDRPRPQGAPHDRLPRRGPHALPALRALPR